VVQRGQQLRLSLEAGQPLAVGGERLRKQLDRHAAIQRRVHRLPDGPHPALTDLLDDAVVQQHLSGFK